VLQGPQPDKKPQTASRGFYNVMALPIFDSIVVGIILISATLSSFRGFTREILAIISWIAAGFAAAFLYPYALPYAQQHIPNPTMALALAIVATFLLTLVSVSFFTSRVADGVAHSRIGALDRTLGLIFGTARGFLLCVLGFLFFTWFIGHDSRQPDWLKNARTRPLLETGSQAVENLWSSHLTQVLPSLDTAEGMLKKMAPLAATTLKAKEIGRGFKESEKTAVLKEEEDDHALESSGESTDQISESPAYGPSDRRRLERLIGGG
jgi:membrane protein required for colicin V production